MTKPKPAAVLLWHAKLHRTVWGKRIISAEIRGEFSARDRRDSSGWTTCACGRVTVDVPRAHWGWPLDGRLYAAGARFLEAVCDNGFVKAARNLIQIERRAAAVAAKNRKATT